MRRWQWNFQRDTNYYFGLFLLVIASASLLWAIWRDAFDPQDFLVYFLIYAWGYILLLKSIGKYRMQRLETRLFSLSGALETLERGKRTLCPRRAFPGTTGLPGDFSGDGSGGEPEPPENGV